MCEHLKATRPIPRYEEEKIELNEANFNKLVGICTGLLNRIEKIEEHITK